MSVEEGRSRGWMSVSGELGDALTSSSAEVHAASLAHGKVSRHTHSHIYTYKHLHNTEMQSYAFTKTSACRKMGTKCIRTNTLPIQIEYTWFMQKSTHTHTHKFSQWSQRELS